jgi:gamma-glutamyltranspeptidase/glutathione hydrolase
VATGRAIDFEHTMAPDLVAGLRALGHQAEATQDSYMDFGSGQFIWRLGEADDGYVAASDSRRDGQAVGY